MNAHQRRVDLRLARRAMPIGSIVIRRFNSFSSKLVAHGTGTYFGYVLISDHAGQGRAWHKRCDVDLFTRSLK